MVFVPALEDLEQPPHFHVAPDDRVEPAAARALDEVVREARRRRRRRRPWRRRPRAGRSSAPPCAGGSDPARAPNAWSTTAAGPRISWESALSRCSTSPCRARFLLRAREQRQHRARQVREPAVGLPMRAERGSASTATSAGRRPPGGRPPRRRVAIERAREEMDRLHLRVLALVGQACAPATSALASGA